MPAGGANGSNPRAGQQPDSGDALVELQRALEQDGPFAEVRAQRQLFVWVCGWGGGGEGGAAAVRICQLWSSLHSEKEVGGHTSLPALPWCVCMHVVWLGHGTRHPLSAPHIQPPPASHMLGPP